MTLPAITVFSTSSLGHPKYETKIIKVCSINILRRFIDLFSVGCYFE